MKTRVVYPQMWLDEKFAGCKLETKVLFFYLISNQQLGLSRYSRLSQRQILFDTGLTVDQLTTAKQELVNLNWVYFEQDWVYHNHQCAYVDYEGRDRVLEAKQQEIEKVPFKIKEVFNRFVTGKEKIDRSNDVKGLITGYEPVLNHKLKTINPKSKRKTKQKEKFSTFESLTEKEIKQVAEEYKTTEKFVKDQADTMKNWFEARGGDGSYSRPYKNYLAALRNFVKKEDKRPKKIVESWNPEYDTMSVDVNGLKRIEELKQKAGLL